MILHRLSGQFGKLIVMTPLCVLPLMATAWAQTGAADPSADDILIGWAMLALFILAAYYLPAIIAFARHHPNRWPIFVINTVFGATGLGWLGSLVWAFSAIHISPSGRHGGESGLNLFVNDPPRHAAPVPVATPITTADPVEELRRLKALRDAGSLDDDEYQRLRTAPLARLTGPA